MDYQETIAQLSPAIYERLKNALETGKWPDGRLLSEVQRQTCMEAVLSYQKLHLSQEEQAGYMAKPCHANKPHINKQDALSHDKPILDDIPAHVINLKPLK